MLRGDGQDCEIIDANLEGKRAGTDESLPDEERAANAAAADFCVPKEKLDSFMARKHPFYYEKDVLAFARVVKRHLPGAIVDGWGQTAHTTP